MPPNIWPKPFKYFEHVRLFLVSVCVVISLAVAAIFLFIYYRASNLPLQRAREQAVTYADLLTHTKMWNYDYGGVYVERKGGVESNAYLKKLGINPDVKAEGGRTFTIRNHAIMTKEISRRSEQHDGTKFRIISLKPLDPENTPDPFETEAIRRFEQGAREEYRMMREKGRPPLFRYLIPLHVEQSCLECHFTQGYKVGGVLGAISITIPAATLTRETDTNKLLIILAAAVTIGLLVGITYFLTWRLVIKLDEVQKRLKRLATTDELTGLKNRRHIMRRLEDEYERARRTHQPLCLIVLDIDHFKRINDTFGHPFGDLVLKQAAARMKDTLRRYDALGRIGGEEFLIISPGTAQEEAMVLAERVCQTVRTEPFSDGDQKVTITLSAGVATLNPADASAEMVLKRADTALYRAKQEGRDRVVAL